MYIQRMKTECHGEEQFDLIPADGAGVGLTGATLLGVPEYWVSEGGSFQPCLLVLKATKATFSPVALGGSL